MKSVLPTFGALRFSCPHCGALAHQYWSEVRAVHLKKDEFPRRFDPEAVKQIKEEQEALPEEDRFQDFDQLDDYLRSATGEVFLSATRTDPYSHLLYNVEVSRCDSCEKPSIWLMDRMVYPVISPSGAPSQDMPDTVRALFEEASAVFPTSPRASAALLRLAMQYLLIELGQPGKDINKEINNLIDGGLDDTIAKTMHALRIIGNESVHPGEIQVNDEPYIAETMFDLLNQVVDQLIAKPRRREELWHKLPEAKRTQVEERLSRKKSD